MRQYRKYLPDLIYSVTNKKNYTGKIITDESTMKQMCDE